MGRRADGVLEREVLVVLWASVEPLAPSEVLDRLSLDLAYTSVATILTRLVAKGLVARSEAGRGFVYSATLSEGALAARRMSETLASVGDSQAVLAGFVKGLSMRDAKSLRALLAQVDE